MSARYSRAAAEAPRTRHLRLSLRPGLALLLPLRARTDEVPPDSFLLVGRRRVNLDRLPAGLARLVPPGYAHAPAEQWQPLVDALEGS
jgi:hypothetical protein